jgi:hypothetical protein
MAKKTETTEMTGYSKERILGSKKYENRRDILGVLLTDGEEYTFDEVDALLDKFMKGKVN